MTLKILHNPRCSKSRATLELLTGRGLDPEIIDYRNDPPSPAELGRIADQPGLETRQMRRSNEAVQAELGHDNPALSRKQLREATAAHPSLVPTPTVIAHHPSSPARHPRTYHDSQ